MKISLVISSLGPGGAERMILILAEHFAKRNHEVTLVTKESSKDECCYPIPSNIRLQLILDDSFRYCRFLNFPLRIYRKYLLYRALVQTKPDIIISFLDTTNILVLRAMLLSKIPVIVCERTDPRFHKIPSFYQIRRKFYYPFAAKVVCQSEEILAWALAHWPFWNTAVIYNPVLPTCVDFPNTPHPFSVKAKQLITMGRLIPSKRIDILIKIFGELHPRFPDWELIILGDGPLRAELWNLAVSKGVEQRVKFLGRVKNPESVLSQGDLFVFTSSYEGFPNALAEAMASGLPAISFDCPSGPNIIIRNGIDGILVPNGDEHRMKEALVELMTDSKKRQEYAKSAPEITDRFHIDKIMDRWENLILSTKPSSLLFRFFQSLFKKSVC